MNNKERHELAAWAVGQAQKSGAGDAAVNISRQRRIQIQYRDQKVEQLQESTQNSLSLRIFANHRYSSHTTNDLRKSELQKFIENAVAMTNYLSEDPYRSLPERKYFEGINKVDLNLVDPEYDNISSARKKELTRKLDEQTRKQSDKIITSSSSYWDVHGHSVKHWSNGFKSESEGTVYGINSEVTVKDGEKGRPEGSFSARSRFLNDMPDPEIVAQKAAQEALQKIGQTKMESGIYEMVVRNRLAGQLVGVLYDAMSGNALQQKSSFLENKLNQQITSPVLTLIDDPFVKRGYGSRLYDDDGLAAKRRVMIEKGILKDYYIDYYYSKKLETEPTTGDSSNLVFELGKESEAELVKKLQKGILVTNFIGGNSDVVTGDFSFGITGLYVEDGKIVKPVNEMNISGNMKDLMMQLVAVGNDPNPYSSWQCPSMYFKDVQFSGL